MQVSVVGAWIGVMWLASVVTGCGGDSNDSGSEADATSGTTASDTSGSTAATSSGGSVTGAGGGSSTSSATNASTGSASGTTGGAADCSGSFGEPSVLFEGAADSIPQSFSITPDELELYYINDTQTDRYVALRVRASRADAFGPEMRVDAFNDVCATLDPYLQAGTIDLMPDGLTAYMACEEPVMLRTTLIVGTRSTLGGAFSVSPTTFGVTGSSFATADGLEGYSNVVEVPEEVQVHQRDSVEVLFSAGSRLSFSLSSPDPSNDGLLLFGSVVVPGSSEDPLVGHQLAVARRTSTSAPFGTPTSDGFPVPPPSYSDRTPTISADCRSLYFLRFSSEEASYAAMVTER